MRRARKKRADAVTIFFGKILILGADERALPPLVGIYNDVVDRG